MVKREIRLGTRGSKLALWQANHVKDMLESKHPDLSVSLDIIKTTGDRILDVPLSKVGGKALFVKEIEEALLDGKIDFAVHSMKDVPTLIPPGLEIGVITEREDPRDAFISPGGRKLEDLPASAIVGTSSLRRQAQLLNQRPDLEVVGLRGNLDTRLRKVEEGTYDAIILAAAGLKRMGWEDRITEYLDPSCMIPAIGQGALGIESREGEMEILGYLSFLEHEDSATAVKCERAFLTRLEGGCQVPIAAHAVVTGESVGLTGLVASTDGKRVVRGESLGPKGSVESLGVGLAEELLGRGGEEILEEVYREG